MISEIEERYAESLLRSESFLKSKNTTVRSTSITDARELCLLRNKAECPICGIEFSGKNHNTEHIHPRSLGGLNNDENKIQMCTACNNARNLTMQSMLGNPPYYTRYGRIKTAVNEFILWSEITADEGFVAGGIFTQPNELFNEARFSNVAPSTPKRAYGRFSTWDKEDIPNHKVNKINRDKTPSKVQPTNQNRGLFTRFFDWVFDYQPSGTDSDINSKPTALSKNFTEVIVDDIVEQSNPIQDSSTNKESNSGKMSRQIISIKNGYPLVTYLNTSNRGLKFPKEPRNFALSLEWFIENALSYPTREGCLKAFKDSDTLATRSKGVPVLANIIQAYSSDGKFESITKQDLLLQKKDVVQLIAENLCKKVAEMSFIEKKDEFLEEMAKYFDAMMREFSDFTQNERFPLASWLQSNWIDDRSYPTLRKAIVEFEQASGLNRNFRTIIKEDFEIPKSWPVAKITNRITQLKSEFSD